MWPPTPRRLPSPWAARSSFARQTTAPGSSGPTSGLRGSALKGNKALAGGSISNPGGGGFVSALNGRAGHVVLIDLAVGGPNVADQNYADGGNGGGSVTRIESVSVTNTLFQRNGAQNGEIGGLRINSMSGEGGVTLITSNLWTTGLKPTSLV